MPSSDFLKHYRFYRFEDQEFPNDISVPMPKLMLCDKLSLVKSISDTTK